MANKEATQCPTGKRTGEPRRRLAVPLFDLTELPSRQAPQRPRPKDRRAPAHFEDPQQGKPSRESTRREVVWTPEGEARRRLAELLAEAGGASRQPAAKPAPSWQQLTLPGWGLWAGSLSH